MNAQYARQLILPDFGAAGQQALADTRVLVIGAGGLGCPLLQYLVAAGVGSIQIIDGDTVSISNLHRQVLYNFDDLNQPKALVAAKKLALLNPNCKIEAVTAYITSENADHYIGSDTIDIVADGSDNFATRYLVNDACFMYKKPLVFGSVFQWEGQLSIFNYPVGQGPNYRCLFPQPPENVPDCATGGVLGVLPGIIGSLMALEVIKIATGIGEPLSGKLLVFNAKEVCFRTFGYHANPNNPLFTGQITNLAADNYIQFCNTIASSETINQITGQQLLAWYENKQPFLLLDVRTCEEYEQENIGGKLIPLAELAGRLDQLHQWAANRPIVIHCQAGGRSLQAATLLNEFGFDNLWNLAGGIIGIPAAVKELIRNRQLASSE
jgi:adenylyltransferase/sulfurtransferase